MPKILVADDSIAVRKVAERLLTEAGLGVTLAANGEEALAYLSKERPDVVVSDVIMPDKSGYEVCAFVRGHAALATTPVLLISGIVNDEVTKQAESCHADGVLKKPFQGTSLKDRVLELLAKRQEPAVAAAPVAAVPKPAVSPDLWTGPRITEEQLETYKQAVAQLKEVDAQLRAERSQSEGLKLRAAELEALSGRARELEVQLDAERRRSAESHDHLTRAQALESELVQEREQIVSLKTQLARGQDMQSKMSELETALREANESIQQYREQVASLEKKAGMIPQLEAALASERAAAEKLVEQVTVLEAAAAGVKDLEARLASQEQRAAEYQRQAKQAEETGKTEQTRAEQLSGRLAEAEQQVHRLNELDAQLSVALQTIGTGETRIRELEKIAVKVQELESEVAAERERNAVLARRVAESEQSAEQSNKRFEDMARKLGEIAGLASQLGSGKGRV